MFTALSLLGIVLFAAGMLKAHFGRQKQIHINEMRIIYERMEVFAYQNNLQNKGSVIRYLTPFKFFVINWEQEAIFEMSKIVEKIPAERLEELRKSIKVSEVGIPEELREMENEFNEHFKKVLRSRLYNLFDCTLIIFMFVILVILSLFRLSFKSVRELYNSILNSITPQSAYMAVRLGLK